jgi:anhydro-N-acetylmuramic acid kinase
LSGIELKLGRGPHLAIGLMSGTSHDGISAALVEIDERRRPPVRLLEFSSAPYKPGFRRRLLAAATGPGAGGISMLNFELGALFGRAARDLMRKAKVAPRRISFIGSHGHTMAHSPPGRSAARGATASTMQIGETAIIAAATGVPVVADFRPMDLAVGGQGAPLAPLAHLWLFADPLRARVIQNVGGIANATYIPRARIPGRIRPLAFDTGPGVMMIDELATRMSSGRMRMDRDGRLAAAGRIHERLLDELMGHPYFKLRPPKSTGREEFGSAALDRIWQRSRSLKVAADDLIATVTALTARSIADACHRFIPLVRGDQMIVTGGGARNPVLMRMIASELPELDVMIAADVGVDGDALEAMAFAILAYQMIRGRPGNLPSVTGARVPAILGKLTMPPLWRSARR